MTTLNITLDESTAAYLERKRQAHGFKTPAEYILFVVTQDKLSAERQRLEELLLEGIDSGPGEIVDDEFWERFELEHFGRLLTEEDA